LTPARRHGDAGQAFPVYITVVGGLLFLAFAYFAVGQATVNRGDAQTAADAAALGAALETRDDLAGQWVDDILDPERWQDIFDGDGAGNDCWRAQELAARNDAQVTACDAGLLRYTVEVQTNKTVGKSLVPGTENRRSHASATAVIESLCTFDLSVPPVGGSDPDDADEEEEVELPPLTCDGGRKWELDPEDLADLPDPEDLFDVHLAD
jgi:hypothetical protein